MGIFWETSRKKKKKKSCQGFSKQLHNPLFIWGVDPAIHSMFAVVSSAQLVPTATVIPEQSLLHWWSVTTRFVLSVSCHRLNGETETSTFSQHDPMRVVASSLLQWAAWKAPEEPWQGHRQATSQRSSFQRGSLSWGVEWPKTIPSIPSQGQGMTFGLTDLFGWLWPSMNLGLSKGNHL